MANSSKVTAVILNVVLMLSLLLISISSVAESRFLGGHGMVKEEAAGILCDLVHGVESGETCSGVVEKFKLNAETFTLINPNLNCDALFVGQWVCIDGASN
ncbi:hypothetical protein F2P56_008794 [Juglans regia]|uniref:Uncharacterized protein LOC118348246 n=2 Tax=Juglans regia TaxID=51240 RepID=A0A6P9ECW6_JUGRE|nr:uncharacterized protein LOC118348246 [Juglans regia]KAF5472046.1 hypothetical protein F2P56_008794 [Juglans regia]